MPVYEYKCSNCGHEFEEVKKLLDFSDTVDCPACGIMYCCSLLISNGFTHGDCPVWLNDDVRNSIQGDGEPPVETRTQYDRYLSEKNIVKI